MDNVLNADNSHVANTVVNTELKEDAKAKAAAELNTLKEIKDLFASSHDLIAQAQYPGHAFEKIGRVLAFLKFQYNDFCGRVERAEKAMSNVVDVPAAQAATKEALAPEATPKA